MDPTVVALIASGVILLALISLFSVPFIIKSAKKRKARKRANLNVDIQTLSADDPLFDDALKAAAIEICTQHFISIDKPVFTKQGEYRANFMNEVSKTREELMLTCCSGNALSDDYCRFVEYGFQDLRAKDLSSTIVSYYDRRQHQLKLSFDQFLSNFDSVTPQEFFQIRQFQKGDVVGVYVIHNESREMYYVGQAKRLFFRVNQHFTGHGNGDVYADYKYGDDFSIKLVKLSDSGYSDLDLLEKDLIERYSANITGYNRTSGNG